MVLNVVFVVFCTGGLGLVGVVVLSADFPRYQVLGDGWEGC